MRWERGSNQGPSKHSLDAHASVTQVFGVTQVFVNASQPHRFIRRYHVKREIVVKLRVTHKGFVGLFIYKSF